MMVLVLTLLLLGQEAFAATCNLCGCEGCKPGNIHGIVHFQDPQNPNNTLQNSCQALTEIVSKNQGPFNQTQCDNLYKRATQVCACFYENGTDVEPYNGGKHTSQNQVSFPPVESLYCPPTHWIDLLRLLLVHTVEDNGYFDEDDDNKNSRKSQGDDDDDDDNNDKGSGDDAISVRFVGYISVTVIALSFLLV